MGFKKGNKLGKKFEPGNNMNPSGRPKKFLTEIKGLVPWTDSQIIDCVKTLSGMPVDELKAHLQSDKSQMTIAEQIIGRALLSDADNFSQRNLMEQLRMLIPAPKQEHEVNITTKQKFRLSDGTELEM